MNNEQLAAHARAVLQRNDLGTMVAAAPKLYPHQWSWDAAFIAIGLADMSVTRAITEMRTLLAAQWSTGMIPHIVFAPDPGYFPGPDVWGTDRAAAKPAGVQTSGICQPPVHAIAIARIVEIARARGGADATAAEEFAREACSKLAAWHRWLSTVRDPDGRGLVEIHHGWESGMDNSPRWDDAYAAITVTHKQELRRHDTALVADVSERPSDEEYQRYLHLVAQMREVAYDDALVSSVVDFRVGDVFMTAILAVAADDLADLVDSLGLGADLVAEQRAIGARARAAVVGSIDPATGLCRDYDALRNEWTSAESLASFSTLICGADAEIVERQKAIVAGPRWAGHPDLRFAVPPSLSPDDAGFKQRTYWRGPIWPVMNWLFTYTLARGGDAELAARWREQGLAQLADDAFGEYYDPLTAEPLGSHDQSWTAAVALDWIGDGTQA